MLFTVLVAGGWRLKIFGISVPVIRIADGLGKAGTQSISKISAFILLAIGVQIIREGVRTLPGTGLN